MEKAKDESKTDTGPTEKNFTDRRTEVSNHNYYGWYR